MIHFEKLMYVKDTCSYSNLSAIAQYNGNAKVGIDIYLHRTCICEIDLLNQSFKLANCEWDTNITLKALKEWKIYLQDQGYKLVDLEWTGTSPERFNLDVRIAANAHLGGYIMKNNNVLQCNHVGKSDGQLKSLPVDEFYISSPTDYQLDIQPHGCYMRGRNEKAIAQYVQEHRGIEFTLHFSLPEAPEMYGIWIHNEELFLFKFRAKNTAFSRDFQSLNVTYTAVEMYKAANPLPLNVAYMMELESSAYSLYQNMLSEFNRLV